MSIDKKGNIISDNFQKGIAPSPAFGFQEIRCCDITTKPGWVTPNFALAKESGTTVDQYIKVAAYDENGVSYWVGDTKVYKRTSNGTWSVLTGHSASNLKGLAVWTLKTGGSAFKPYLFLFTDSNIDLYDINGTAWTNGWASIGGDTSSSRPTIVAQDNVLYFGMGYGYGVGSVSVADGQNFDPTDSDTYVIKNASDQALDLTSSFFKVTAFAEQGGTLAIGTEKPNDKLTADIYMWDKVSASFSDVLHIGGEGIKQIISYNNLLYIQTGGEARWYQSNGTSSIPFADLPQTLIDVDRSDLFYLSNSAVLHRDLIYFGVGSTVTSASGYGVYSLNPITAAINYENLISTGNDGSDGVLQVGAILPVDNDEFLAAWEDEEGGSTFGVDKTSTTRYTGDSAYVISEFYGLATPFEKLTFPNFEAKLTKNLTSGQSVKIQTREVQGGAWTTRATFDTVGKKSFRTPSAITNVENLQVKTIINGDVDLINSSVKRNG